MIFNNLGEIFYIIHALESTNTSVCITDANQKIIYESSHKDYKYDATIEDMNSFVERLRQEQNAIFRIQLIDCVLTAITTVPVFIGKSQYFMELKQHVSRIKQYGLVSSSFDNLSIHQIKEMAITDALTKLYNRRYIDERLPIDMQSSFELDEPISILFIDIDCFKEINDTYGHAVGDQVLCEVALLLQKQFNKGNGWVARYGGDEILVCLPGCVKHSAKRIANRLRKTIETNTFKALGKEIQITCSIGVQTTLRDSGIKSISELIRMADMNLYRAKSEGRNKVI